MLACHFQKLSKKANSFLKFCILRHSFLLHGNGPNTKLNRPGFPGEYFICELRLPDHRFRWKHNKL
ncbi:hypothetical protein F9050_12555, partial [Escherichia coli]